MASLFYTYFVFLIVVTFCRGQSDTSDVCKRNPELLFCQAQQNSPPPDAPPTVAPKSDDTDGTTTQAVPTTASQSVADDSASSVRRKRDSDNYCSRYDRHHDYFCKEKNVVSDQDSQNRATKFCASYDSVCGADYKEKLKQYCSKYVQHYQTYCKNPLEHGAAAVRFCPLYAQECSGDFSVPLLEDFTTPNPLLAAQQQPSSRRYVTYFPPESQTAAPPLTRLASSSFVAAGGNGFAGAGPSQLPQQQVQPQVAAVQPQTSQVQPAATAVDQSGDPTVGGPKTPQQIQAECDRNRARATAYCFGPIGQSSLYKKKCDLFKQYCVNN